MDHYTDIKLLPDPEFPATVLMNSLYAKLHKTLCDLSSNNIGVSFPLHRKTLGAVLRLHGTREALARLQRQNWLGGMRGYCEMGEISAVPDNCQHRVISRVQPRMSQAKLNRLIKRNPVSQEQVKQYKARMCAQGLDHPFLELTSGSNGHKHRRFIQFGALTPSPVPGQFDQFGLAKTATVPWF